MQLFVIKDAIFFFFFFWLPTLPIRFLASFLCGGDYTSNSLLGLLHAISPARIQDVV